jgi:hypothetical protein
LKSLICGINLVPNAIIPFSDEQLRLLVNLEQQYEVWIDAEQSLARLPYGLKWKTVAKRGYLYEVTDRNGNGKSLGPRSDENEAIFDKYRRQKDTSSHQRDQSAARLAETCRIYRALRLPLLASEAATILREADRRNLLGSHLLVIGTNAMAAYAIEAGGRIVDAPDETQDFDLAWTARDSDQDANPVWSMLKAVDKTYTVNSERTFQARNAAAYEVEILVAPSRAGGLSRRDQPRPVPLDEQEWLLNGKTVSRVVVARDSSPARIIAPDPRWFALHKLWMSDQNKRNPLKRGKDSRQGTALLNAIWQAMPQYPLDSEFEAEIPPVLLQYYAIWKATVAEKPAATPRW